MPLEMILAISKGECQKCHKQEQWLYPDKGKLVCDDCLWESEQEDKSQQRRILGNI